MIDMAMSIIVLILLSLHCDGCHDSRYTIFCIGKNSNPEQRISFVLARDDGWSFAICFWSPEYIYSPSYISIDSSGLKARKGK